MALRLIEMIVKERQGEKINELLKDYKILEHRQIELPSGELLIRILLDAEKSEPILDLLDKHNVGGTRIIILPVEATLPRAIPEPKLAAAAIQPSVQEQTAERVSREELYENIKSVARCSRSYMLMVLLSTIVAVIGIYRNNATILIGAMMIAPLLGPNMALAIGATLGDLNLLWQAFRTSLIGIAIAMILAMLVGFIVPVDLTFPEVASRALIAGPGDIVLALAAGSAGALSFMSSGISTALIGVMVAVALLPPLVVFGLLLGGGQLILAIQALLLFLLNLVGVNFAGVLTFLFHGIHPVHWWEKNRAAKASYIIIGLSLMILFGAIVIILLLRLAK